ncbi:hypothetical protein AMELA_G00296210, partial [Ameiurus melas]
TLENLLADRADGSHFLFLFLFIYIYSLSRYFCPKRLTNEKNTSELIHQAENNTSSATMQDPLTEFQRKQNAQSRGGRGEPGANPREHRAQGEVHPGQGA